MPSPGRFRMPAAGQPTASFCVVKGLFANLRDVKRFISALSFTFPMVEDEVNPVDFIGLEALRVFVPDIYAEIGRRKSLFLNTLDLSRAFKNATTGRQASEESGKELERVMYLAGNRSKAVKGIFKELFPQLVSVFGDTPSEAGSPDDWRSDRRICSEDMFDRYFLLGVPAGDITYVELEEIVNASENPETLETILDGYYEANRLTRLTDWLPGIIKRLSEAGVLSFCHVLISIIENRTDIRRSINSWGTVSRLAHLIDLALRRLPEDQRCQWLHEELKSGENLYAIVNQVAREERTQGRRPSNPLLKEDCVDELQEACVERLRVAAKTGELRKVRNILGILLVWKHWSNAPHEVDGYLDTILAAPEGTLDFVADCMYEIVILAGPTEPRSVHWKLNLDNLDELTDLDTLEHAMLDAQERVGRLSDRQKLAIEVFAREMQRRRGHSEVPQPAETEK